MCVCASVSACVCVHTFTFVLKRALLSEYEPCMNLGVWDSYLGRYVCATCVWVCIECRCAHACSLFQCALLPGILFVLLGHSEIAYLNNELYSV